ncbi:MAG: hypothetical protein AAGG51_03760 [Cyanobacteria bacterium P01_G01_bin.54]
MTEPIPSQTSNSQADNRSGDHSADSDYIQQASDFIHNTSLDRMHEIAEAARLKKLAEPPKWVIPDEF